MDTKTLLTLEYPKILEKIANWASFTGSADLARAMRPTSDLSIARDLMAQTTEARRVLDLRPQTSIGAAHDVRDIVESASRGMVLEPPMLLDVKSTLVAARELTRIFERFETQFPLLTEIVSRIPPPSGLIDAISGIISDRGEILDNASPRLAEIRRELRIVHDRLLSRMQSMLSDPKISPYLQDNLITQRDGRYVIPLNADFKGKVQSIVHDQSSSGATLFVEPLSVVNLNNEYRELQLAERNEERRLLAELSRQVGDRLYDLDVTVESIAELDFAFARAKYAEAINASEPQLVAFHKPIPLNSEVTHPGSVIRLQGARHPLLDPTTVVPIDVILNPHTYSVIITGPNTGGKTVTLKTVGLLALMAQSGFHIPVDPGSSISVFTDIFADIGDEQSIEQSLSTFSAHITNIIRVLDAADSKALVLFDELGSGTDPQEGAALAMGILTYLLDKSITTFVATHYPEMKSFALGRVGVVNASVEFDVETLRPTYHLVIGLPGSSNAFTIARRLGLPDNIITIARTGISAEELRVEDLLTEIQQQRELIRKTRKAAEQVHQETEKLREQLTVRLDVIEDERREILEGARQKGEDELEKLQQEIAELRRKLTQARQPLEIIEEVEEVVAELEEEVAVPIVRKRVATDTSELQRPLQIGDQVRLRSLGSQGVVSSLSQAEAEIQIGVLRVRTRLSELELVSGIKSKETPGHSKPSKTRKKSQTIQLPTSPGIELDLRGQRVDEAIDRLSDYLDRAYLANVPWVRIIHGKGTGRLRDAVRNVLRTNTHVSTFEAGGEGEGGDGVTVVKFNE